MVSRSILFISVLCLLCTAAVFSGSVAAETADETILEGETYWEGQILERSDGIKEDKAYSVYENESGFIAEFKADNGTLILDSADLGPGNYTIKRGSPIVSFGIEKLAFDTEPSEPRAYDDETYFEFDLRTYVHELNVTVHSDEFTPSELQAIFADMSTPVEQTEDGVLLREVSTTSPVKGRVDEIEYGANTFELSVQNTTSNTTVTARKLKTADSPAVFNSYGYSTALGDEAHVSMTLNRTTEATVQIGTDIYTHEFTVQDTDGDEQVVFYYDTYDAGFGTKPVRAGEGTDITQYTTDTDVGGLLAGLTYEMVTRVDGEETDSALLGVRTPEHHELTTLTMPETEPYTRTAIENHATETGEVAEGDPVILKIGASGLYSFLTNETEPADLKENSSFAQTHGLYLDITEETAQINRNRRTVNLSNGQALITAPDEEAFYVVFEADDLPKFHEQTNSRQISRVNTFNARFVRTNESRFVPDDQPDEVLTADFDVTDRVIVPDLPTQNRVGDDAYVIETTDTPVIEADTSLAPGTTVLLRLRNKYSTFYAADSATVTENRTLSYEFNLTDLAADDELTMTVRNEDISFPVLVNTPPRIRSLTVKNSPVEGKNLRFTANTTDEVKSLDYNWSFGDGTSSESGLGPMHSYDEPGEYTVQLTITDNLGRQATKSLDVEVAANEESPPKPIPTPEVSLKVDSDTTVFTGEPVTARAIERVVPQDALRFKWEYGNSVMESGAEISRSYPVPGEYTLSVTVTTADGKQDTASTQIRVIERHDLIASAHRFGELTPED